MVLTGRRAAALLAVLAPAACTVPAPAPAPAHRLGPEMHAAADSTGHLQLMTTLARCARARQQRQQAVTPPADSPSAAECAAAERQSRSPAELELAQPQ